jgi:hypothetical protein
MKEVVESCAEVSIKYEVGRNRSYYVHPIINLT